MMSDLDWSYSEFLTFLLLHAAYADLEFSEDEKKIIQAKVDLKTYEKISDQYDTMGEFERLSEIMKYKDLYFPTQDRKAHILGEMKRLFESDGSYSKLEVNLMQFLQKLF